METHFFQGVFICLIHFAAFPLCLRKALGLPKRVRVCVQIRAYVSKHVPMHPIVVIHLLSIWHIVCVGMILLN